jgi:hypothetical protein
MLGVRLGDVLLDADANHVLPGHGMSVTIGDIRELPFHRLPFAYGGLGKDPVYEMRGELPASLEAVPKPVDSTHWEVCPRQRCPLEEYEHALAGTRPAWRRIT